jgi:hypothetical protein
MGPEIDVFRTGRIHSDDDVIASSFPFIWNFNVVDNLAEGAPPENSLRPFESVGSFQFGVGG